MHRLIGVSVFAVLASTSVIASAAQPAPIRIEVPHTDNMQFFTLWVALGAHFFEAEGLQPKLVVDATPRDAGQKLMNGEADVALLQPPMFLGMMAEEKPIVLFASLLANEPINLVVRKDVADARNLSSAGSVKARLQAIKGLRVGVAGEPPPRLRALFRSAGMDADKDVRLVIVRAPEQVQALADGKVDALFAHTPYLETALVKYRALLLVETSSGEVRELSDGQVHALATTRATMRDNPALIDAATRAITRAERLIRTDPKATVDAVLSSGTAGRERPLVEAIVAVYRAAVPVTPAISLKGIERDAVLYPAHPRAPDFTRVKAADFVAPEFAARAAAALR